MEEIIKEETLYTGHILTLVKATVRLADGTLQWREIVRHHGAAGVLAVARDRALFVRQWRTPLAQWTLEVPAGRIEPGETAQQTAARELNEEAGLASDDWRPLTSFYQAAGFSDARMTLWLARAVRPVVNQRPQDPGEAVTTQWLTLPEAQAAMAAGQICDSKTVLAVALWAQLGDVDGRI